MLLRSLIFLGEAADMQIVSRSKQSAPVSKVVSEGLEISETAWDVHYYKCCVCVNMLHGLLVGS